MCHNFAEMYIRKIVLSNFKNIKELRLDFSPKINCISGNNGAGKTNLLDAVHYLSMTRSYFSVTDRYTFMHGTDDVSMNAFYKLDDGTEDRALISVGKSSGKVIKRNDKVCRKASEYIGRYPVVMVSPYDTNLINDASEERRRFMNLILSQVDAGYLRDMQNYNQLLQQRNRLLKGMQVPDDLLDTFSERLSHYAARIYEKRVSLCEDLRQVASEYYSVLSPESESIDLVYDSDLHDGNLEDILSANRERDRFLKYTLAGVHRDDITMLLSGYPIRKCGSQGQQKSFLIALKMAQYSIMKRLYGGISPILLLDDVFDKLDMDRVARLLKMVAGDSFGQIFITDSNKVRMENVVSSITDDHCSFVMEGGSCRRI